MLDSDGKKSFYAAELQLQWIIKQRGSQNTLVAPVSNYLKCHTGVFVLELTPWKCYFMWKWQVNNVWLRSLLPPLSVMTAGLVWLSPDVFYWCLCASMLWFVVSCWLFFSVWVVVYGFLLFHVRLCYSVLNCEVSHCVMSFCVVLCCVHRTFLACSDNRQDADRSTASHPDLRSTMCLKKEPLTTYSDKVGEGDSMGCDHTYSPTVCYATSIGLSDTVVL